MMASAKIQLPDHVFTDANLQELLRSLRKQGVDPRNLQPYPILHPRQMGFDNFLQSVLFLTEFGITISGPCLKIAAAHGSEIA